MFLSTYTSEELVRFKTISDVYYVLGVMTSSIIQPPRCKVCGEYCYIDEVMGLCQCSHCNRIYTLYYSESLNLRKEWAVYHGKDN